MRIACPIAIVLVTLLAGATASAETPSERLRAEGVEPEVVAHAETLVEHYDALATVIETAGTERCTVLADALEAFVAERGDALRAAAARLASLDADTEARLQAAWADDFESIQQRMLAPLSMCVADERVVAAMESLSTAPDEPDPGTPADDD